MSAISGHNARVFLNGFEVTRMVHDVDLEVSVDRAVELRLRLLGHPTIIERDTGLEIYLDDQRIDRVTLSPLQAAERRIRMRQGEVLHDDAAQAPGSPQSTTSNGADAPTLDPFEP